MAELFGTPVSQGTVAVMSARAAGGLGGFLESVRVDQHSYPSHKVTTTGSLRMRWGRAGLSVGHIEVSVHRSQMSQ